MLIAARSSQDFACCCTRNRERTLEIRFRFRCIRLWRLERDFAGDAIDLGLAPRFFGRFDRRHCFANAAPGVIELAEFRMGPRQI